MEIQRRCEHVIRSGATEEESPSAAVRGECASHLTMTSHILSQESVSSHEGSAKSAIERYLRCNLGKDNKAAMPTGIGILE